MTVGSLLARPACSPPAAAAAIVAGAAHSGTATSDGDTGGGATTGPVCPEVSAVRAAAAALASVAGGASGWSGVQRHEVLTELNVTIDTLAAVRSSVLIAERDAETWRGHGDPNFEAWVGRKTRLGKRGGAARVRQATELDTVPDVRDAVTAGTLPLEHAGIIAKVAATGTPTQRAAATSPAGQELLLGLAAGQDAATFARTADRWAATIDPDGLERDHQAQYRARFLHLTHTPNGTHLKGLLDSITGHQVALALEAATPRPAADDDRDTGQRHADALATIADRILASTDTKPGAHVPPQVSVILTEATWAATQADRARRQAALTTFGLPNTDTDTEQGQDTCGTDLDGATGNGSGTGCSGGPVVLPALSYPPATLEDGTPLPATELGVILCDCELTRIVINAHGIPLDLGRTERLFTGPQRKAVIARDRECAWPHCHAHARWCHIHHLTWWHRDNGATSVENGALLCNFHHHEVHRQNLTLTRHTTTDRDTTGLARVWYQITDPTGRQLHPPPTGQSPAARAPQAARPPELTASAGPPRASASPRLSEPRAAEPGLSQAELDLFQTADGTDGQTSNPSARFTSPDARVA